VKVKGKAAAAVRAEMRVGVTANMSTGLDSVIPILMVVFPGFGTIVIVLVLVIRPVMVPMPLKVSSGLPGMVRVAPKTVALAPVT